MNKKIILLLSVSASLFATPAMAGEGRVEVRTGYTDTDVDIDIDEFDISESASGISLGGAVGYDFDISSKLFVGGEISADYSSANINTPDVFLSSGTEISVIGRLGINAGEKTKIYGLIGGTSISIDNDDQGGIDDDSGLVYGAGVQHNIGKKFYLKGEYRRTEFSISEVLGAQSFDADINIQRLLVGVGFRF